jgi:hypothetical protein
VEGGLFSGPVTHTANMLGNTVFMAARAPMTPWPPPSANCAAASPGQRVEFAEPLARIIGAPCRARSTACASRAAVMRTGEDPPGAGKVEQYRKAIEGKKGELIRLPFRALSAEDAIFRTMNERGELYALAVRQATSEGLNPLTSEFRTRIASLMRKPDPGGAAASKDAAERFTFNKELGEKGKAVQEFVRTWHLEWLLPFIRTPSNIIKEMARLTPMAPLVKEWRDAIREGGVARDKALAEVAVGTTLMTTGLHPRAGRQHQRRRRAGCGEETRADRRWLAAVQREDRRHLVLLRAPAADRHARRAWPRTWPGVGPPHRGGARQDRRRCSRSPSPTR